MSQENVEHLKTVQFEVAKRRWAIASISGFCVLVLGVIVLFTDRWNLLLALLAGGGAVVDAYFRWRSDTMKDAAESMLRRFEMHDALGWPVSQRELRDMRIDGPKSVRIAVESPEVRTYFASTSGVGWRRALENLEESAWWSKHLSKRMAALLFWVAVIVISLGFSILILAFQSTTAPGTAEQVSQIVIALLVFLFSNGYLRLAIDYKTFADAAQQIELQAEQQLKRDVTEETEVILLQHDYQIARAQSPLIPDRIYRLMEPALNELWKQKTSLSARRSGG